MRRWLPGAVLLLLLVAAGARAEGRHALLIGAHHGAPGEPTLRYAGADAERLREVLVTLGEFLPEDVVVLTDPSADRVRQVLSRLNVRIREESERGRASLFLVFYSGHADALSLHLGRTTLPWEELRNLTGGSAATARLLVVDACRSGQATRVKGTQLSTPLALPPGPSSPEGFAILSSAASSESAQESDALGGSFFTHHLVAALRGVGDTSGDGLVTLAEAHAYAAERTVASTVATVAGVQHPTYLYELKGRSDLVLTRPALARGLATVRLSQPGQYFLREKGAEGPLVVEASIADAPRTVRLPVGRYFVQRRLPERLYEGTLELPGEGTFELASTRLRPVELDALVRKGGSSVRRAWSLGAWAAASASPVPDFPMTLGPLVSVSLDTPDLTFDAVAELSRGTLFTPALVSRVTAVSARLGARKVVDVRWASLSAGIRLGAAHMRQSYEGEREAPPRWQLVPQLDTVVRTELRLPLGAFVGLEGGVRASLLRVRGDTPRAIRTTPVVPLVAAGGGLRW